MSENLRFWSVVFACALLAGASSGCVQPDEDDESLLVVGDAGNNGSINGGTGGDKCVDMEGSWEGKVKVDSRGCGGGQRTEQVEIRVEQYGCNVKVFTEALLLEGTVEGNEVTVTGHSQEAGDDTKATESVLRLENGHLTGTIHLEIPDGGGSCKWKADLDVTRGSGGSDPNNGSGGGTLEAGAECDTDADCKGDMACLPDAIGVSRYCAPQCNDVDDCDAMYRSENFTLVSLPEKFQGSGNAWEVDALHRGVSCNRKPDDEQGPNYDGQRYCVYWCGKRSFLWEHSDQGWVCSCWPNHRRSQSGEGCVWDSEVECSILNPCETAPNADPNCPGDITCIAGKNLEGTCFSKRSGDQIEACLRKCDRDCDASCISGCGTSSTCLESCCDTEC